MSQLLWILDPDPTSAQSMRSAIDLLGPEIETLDHVPNSEHLAQAVLIAGSVGAEQLDRWIGELRRMGGNDLLPITIVGDLSSSAEALALGADHYLPFPLILADLWDHLRRFLTLSSPSDLEREIIQSRGFITPEPRRHEPASESQELNEPDLSREPEQAVVDASPDDQVAPPETPLDESSIHEPNDPPESEATPLNFEPVMSAQEPEDEPSDSTDKSPVHELPQTSSEPLEPQTTALETPPVEDSLSDGLPEQNAAAEQPNQELPPPQLSDDPSQIVDEEPVIESPPLAPESLPQTTESKASDAEDLFGLKQPEEVERLSQKSEEAQKDTEEWNKEQPQSGGDLTSDSAWGLDGEVESNEPATVGWDDAGDDSWGDAAQAESGWGDAGDDSWGDQTSSDGSWGGDSGSDGEWGDKKTNDDGWGSEAEPSGEWNGDNGWGANQGASDRPSSLTQIGEQLMPASPKPRAPVSALGQLGSTGLLGLLARCGNERVSGRVTWRGDQESAVLHLEDGRLKAMHSGSFDHDLLQAAFAQSWIDAKELAGVRHLMQRRHSSAASVLAREGVKTSSEIQKLAQDTAERILLRCANTPGGQAQFHPEMGYERAVAVSQVDMVSRLIALSESLVQASIWVALVGGDDAVPILNMTPLPQNLPGRDALHHSDGQRSLLELATASGVSIHDVRAGCLAALAIGQIELVKVGVSSIQQSHRPDQTFERALRQIRSGDYFTVLGLAEAHSATEVHRAFAARVSLLRLHLHTNHPRFAEAYQELEEAREVLLDPDLRAQYRSANPKLVER